MEKEYILRDKKRVRTGNFEENLAHSVPNNDHQMSTWEVKVAPADFNQYSELPSPYVKAERPEVKFQQDADIPNHIAPPLPNRNNVTLSKKPKLKRVRSVPRDKTVHIDDRHGIIPIDTEGEEVYAMLRSITDTGETYLQPVSVVTRNIEPIPKYLDHETTSDLRRRRVGPRKLETVYIKIAFLKLGEIRTKHEDFAADIFLQAKWRERKLDKKSWVQDYELHDIQDYWDPEISIENGVGVLRENIWHIVTHERNGNAYICEKRRVKGVFSEQMELSDYPFDTQNFTITIISNRRESEVLLKRDPADVDDLAIQTFVDQQEWTLHKTTEVVNDIATFTNKKQTYKRPTIGISIKATRKASYFVFNIVLFMIFICSLIFATFAVEYTLVQNRLQLAFILMLSNITFKRVVSDTLPKVSYLTYLDHYVIWQTTVMFLVSVWHAIVFQIPNSDHALLADRIALAVCAAIYLISHIVFFCRWGLTFYRQKQYTFLNTFVH